MYASARHLDMNDSSMKRVWSVRLQAAQGMLVGLAIVIQSSLTRDVTLMILEA